MILKKKIQNTSINNAKRYQILNLKFFYTQLVKISKQNKKFQFLYYVKFIKNENNIGFSPGFSYVTFSNDEDF